MAIINKVNFVGGTQTLFNSVVNKDPNALYFISDTQRIYKGDVDVTQNVIPVLNFPDVGVENKIYIHQTTFQVRMYDEGKWKTVAPGYVTTLESVKSDSYNGRLVTVGAFKQYVDEVLEARAAKLVNDVEFDNESGTLSVKGEDESSKKSTELTGVAHDPSYDATNLTITIPQYGKEDLVVNLPRDNFLTDAYYEKDYDFGESRGPAIVLVVKTDSAEDEGKKIAIPASAMANDYTAGKSDTISVEIDDSHKIKARLIIDKNTADGTLTIWDDINKKLGTLGVKVNTNTDEEMGESNEVIPTAAIIAAAIKKSCKEISDSLLDEGNPDEVVISTQNGIVRSGIKIGGAVLSDDPTASILATEAAVLDAISWKSLA